MSKIELHRGDWTRAEAEADPRSLYVFTDNTDRTSGMGVVKDGSRYAAKYGHGLHYPTRTSAVVRGLDNAFPVSTQRWYHEGAAGETGRWHDGDFETFKEVIDDEFKAITDEWASGRYDKIMFPERGLVNGRISAITEERTPRLYAYLQQKTEELRSAVGEGLAKEIVNIFYGTGENADLSNFAERPFSYTFETASGPVGPFRFRSVEQAFQYAKTFRSDAPADLLGQLRGRILMTTDGSALRRIGRSVPQLRTKEWNRESPGVMKQLLEESFRANPDAARKLLQTGDSVLTHRQDGGVWGKLFPELLMEVRQTLSLERNLTDAGRAAIEGYVSEVRRMFESEGQKRETNTRNGISKKLDNKKNNDMKQEINEKRTVIEEAPAATVALNIPEDAEERRHLAGDPNTSPEVLAELAKDEDLEVRENVAKNSNTLAETIAELTKDKTLSVRYDVAKNPNTPIEVLAILAKDEAGYVRMGVAINLNTPIEVLAVLAKDEDENVRSDVAKNSNIPIEILVELADDVYSGTRASVAGNPNTPVEVLNKLAKDEDSFVRKVVAENPKTPTATLSELAKDAEYAVREIVAANQHTPVEVLNKLAKDEEWFVREVVASNPNTPVEILNELAEDKSLEVRHNVAYNPNTSIEILDYLAEDDDELTRMYVASNPHTPVDWLSALAEESFLNVREAVAGNPNTPVETLAKLMKDKNESVRQAVVENMKNKSSAESQEASPERVFLLGGSDLEMQSIRKLLEDNGIAYIDKNLSWGASTSAYADELAGFGDDVKVYGIELSETEGVALPKGYVRIDHHNDYSGRKSSIEQVADLLGVEMTRDMQLVAANDSGYIPAMKAMGATDDEVADIRRRDRAAQGVTEEDERLAEDAIRNMTRYEVNDMSVIRTADALSKFSPITDRLFGTKHLFIYNGNEMCYYGPDAHRFGHANDADVKAGKMYYGGSEVSGFFGTNTGAYSPQELEEITKRMAGEIAAFMTMANSVADEIVRGDEQLDVASLKQFCSALDYDRMRQLHDAVVSLVLEKNEGLDMSGRARTEKDASRQFDSLTAFRMQKLLDLRLHGILTYSRMDATDVDSFDCIQDNDVIVYASDREGLSPAPALLLQNEHEFRPVATRDTARMREMGIYPRSLSEAQEDVVSPENINVAKMREQVWNERNSTRKSFELSMSYDEAYSNIRAVFAEAKENPDKTYRLMFKENLRGADKGFWLGIDYLKMCISAKKEVFGDEPAGNIRVPAEWAEGGHFLSSGERQAAMVELPKKEGEANVVTEEVRTEGMGRLEAEKGIREAFDVRKILGAAPGTTAFPVPVSVDVESGNDLRRFNVSAVEITEGGGVLLHGRTITGASVSAEESVVDVARISVTGLKALRTACLDRMMEEGDEESLEFLRTAEKTAVLKDMVSKGTLQIPFGATMTVDGRDHLLEGVAMEGDRLVFALKNDSMTQEEREAESLAGRLAALDRMVRLGPAAPYGTGIPVGGRMQPFAGARIGRDGGVMLSYEDAAMTEDEKDRLMTEHRTAVLHRRVREGSVSVPAGTVATVGGTVNSIVSVLTDTENRLCVSYVDSAERRNADIKEERLFRYRELTDILKNAVPAMPEGATVMINDANCALKGVTTDASGEVVVQWEPEGYPGEVEETGLGEMALSEMMSFASALGIALDMEWKPRNTPDGVRTAAFDELSEADRKHMLTVFENEDRKALLKQEIYSHSFAAVPGSGQVMLNRNTSVLDGVKVKGGRGITVCCSVMGMPVQSDFGELSPEDRNAVLAVYGLDRNSSTEQDLVSAVLAGTVLPLQSECSVAVAGGTVRVSSLRLEENGTVTLIPDGEGGPFPADVLDGAGMTALCEAAGASVDDGWKPGIREVSLNSLGDDEKKNILESLGIGENPLYVSTVKHVEAGQLGSEALKDVLSKLGVNEPTEEELEAAFKERTDAAFRRINERFELKIEKDRIYIYDKVKGRPVHAGSIEKVPDFFLHRSDPKYSRSGFITGTLVEEDGTRKAFRFDPQAPAFDTLVPKAEIRSRNATRGAEIPAQGVYFESDIRKYNTVEAADAGNMVKCISDADAVLNIVVGEPDGSLQMVRDIAGARALETSINPEGGTGIPCGAAGKMFEIRLDPDRINGRGLPYTAAEMTDLSEKFAEFLKDKPDTKLFVTGTGYRTLRSHGIDSLGRRFLDNLSEDGKIIDRSAPETMLTRVIASLLMISTDRYRTFLKTVDPISISQISSDGCPGDMGEYALHAAEQNGILALVRAASGYPVNDPATGEKRVLNEADNTEAYNAYRSFYLEGREPVDLERLSSVSLRRTAVRREKAKHLFVPEIPEDGRYVLVRSSDIRALGDVTFDTLKFPSGIVLNFEGMDAPLSVAGMSVSEVVTRLKKSDGCPAADSPLYDDILFEVRPDGSTALRPGVSEQRYSQFLYDNAFYPVFKTCLEMRPDLRARFASAVTTYLSSINADDTETVVLKGDGSCTAVCDFLNGGKAGATVDRETGEVVKEGRFAFAEQAADQSARPDIGYHIRGRAAVMGIRERSRQEIVGMLPRNCGTVIKLSPNKSTDEYVNKSVFESAMKEAGVSSRVEYVNLRKLSGEEKNALYDRLASRVLAGENITFVTNSASPEYAFETKDVLQEIASRGVDLQWVSTGRNGLKVTPQSEVIEDILLKEDKILVQGTPAQVRFGKDGTPIQTPGVVLHTNMAARSIFEKNDFGEPNFGVEVPVTVGRHRSRALTARETAGLVDVMICAGGHVSGEAFGERRPENVIFVGDLLDKAGRSAFEGRNLEWFANPENAAKTAKALKAKIIEVYFSKGALDGEPAGRSISLGFDGITSAELAYKAFGDAGAPGPEERAAYHENGVDVSRLDREAEELGGITKDVLRSEYGLSSHDESERGTAFNRSASKLDASDLPVTEFSTRTDTTVLFDFWRKVLFGLNVMSDEDAERIRSGFETKEEVDRRRVGIGSVMVNPDLGSNVEFLNAAVSLGIRGAARTTSNASMTYFDGTAEGRTLGAGDRVEAGRRPMSLQNALDRQYAVRHQGLYNKVTEESLKEQAAMAKSAYYASESTAETPGLSSSQLLTLMVAGVPSGDIMILNEAARELVIPDWQALSDLLRAYTAVDNRKTELETERDKAHEAVMKQLEYADAYMKNRSEILDVLKGVALDADLKGITQQKKAIQERLKERGIRYHRDLEKEIEKAGGERLTVSAGEKAVIAFDSAVAARTDERREAYEKAEKMMELYDEQSRNFFSAAQLEHFCAKADALVESKAAEGLSYCDLRSTLYPFSQRVSGRLREGGMDFRFNEDGTFSVSVSKDAPHEPLFDADGKLIPPSETAVETLYMKGAALATSMDSMDPCFFYEGDLGKIQASPSLGVFSGEDSTEEELSFARNVISGTLAKEGVTPVVAVPEPLIGQALRSRGNIERSVGDYRKNASVELARSMVEEENGHAVLVSQKGRDESSNGELLRKNAANGGVNIYPAKGGRNRKGGRNDKQAEAPNWGYRTAAGFCTASTIISESGIPVLGDILNIATLLLCVGGKTAETVSRYRRNNARTVSEGGRMALIEAVDKSAEGVRAAAGRAREFSGMKLADDMAPDNQEALMYPNFEKIDVVRHGGEIHIFVDGSHPDVMKAVRERFEGEAVIHDIKTDPGAMARTVDELRTGAVYVDSPVAEEGVARFDMVSGQYLGIGIEERQPLVSTETLYFVKGSLYDITDVPARAFPDWNLLEDRQRSELIGRADSFFRDVDAGWKDILAELGISTDIRSNGVHLLIDRAGRDLKVMEGNDALLHVYVDVTGRVRLEQTNRLIDDAGDENEHAVIDDRIVSHADGNVRIDDFAKLESEILTSVRTWFAAPRVEAGLKERSDRGESDLHKKRDEGLAALESGLERSDAAVSSLRDILRKDTALLKEMEKDVAKNGEASEYTEKDLERTRGSIRAATERLRLFESARVLSDRKDYGEAADKALVYAMADKSCKALARKETSAARQITAIDRQISDLAERIEKYTLIDTEETFEKLNRDMAELIRQQRTAKDAWRSAAMERLSAEMTRDRIGSATVLGVQGKVKGSGSYDVCADNMVFSVKGCKITDEELSEARKAVARLETGKRIGDAVSSTAISVNREMTSAEETQVASLKAEIAAIDARMKEKEKEIAGYRKTEAEGKITDKKGRMALLKDIARKEEELKGMQGEKDAKTAAAKNLLQNIRSKEALSEKETPRFDINSPDARRYGGLISVPVDGKFLLVTPDCKVLSRPAERIEPLGNGCWYVEYDKEHKNIFNSAGQSMLPSDVDTVYAAPKRNANEKIVRVCRSGEFNYLNIETGKLLLTDKETGAYAGTSTGKAFVNGWAVVGARESDGEQAFLKDGEGAYVLARKDENGGPMMKEGRYVIAGKGEDGVRIPMVNLINEDGECLSPGQWFDQVEVFSNGEAAREAETLAGYISAASGPSNWRELFRSVCGIDRSCTDILKPIDPDKPHCISGLPDDLRQKIASDLRDHARSLGEKTYIKFICSDSEGKMLGGGVFDSSLRRVKSTDITWAVKTKQLEESIDSGMKIKWH